MKKCEEYKINNFTTLRKTVFLVLLVFLFSIKVVAQNTNSQTETKTTTSTLKDSNGEHKTVKNEVINRTQKIEYGQEQPNSINIPTIDSPVSVTRTTTITNPDGSTRTVDIDRSSYYVSDGSIYKLALDASGYILTNGNFEPSLLRKTSTNSYIYKSNNQIAIGYFDLEGNLIIENYDNQSDKVIIKKYGIVK
ncbi:hypothetical protein [Flavobacterium myungsuense]|uniref:Uncharacterized protein n=1 Tax=Flavobacterium myungsuense TaxID=651823 RepID=A0ABW3J238_9FLAO